MIKIKKEQKERTEIALQIGDAMPAMAKESLPIWLGNSVS